MKNRVKRIVSNRRRMSQVVLMAISTFMLAQPFAYADDKWVSTWASAQQGTNVAFGGVTPVFTDQTLRQIVRVTLGGSTLRVRFSNVIGTTPLVINTATVARRATGAAIDGDSLRPLTFSGSDSVTIPDGAFVLSDPVSLNVAAFDDLAISVYLAGERSVDTQHGAALQTSYVSIQGDHTRSIELPVESTNESWYLLSAVDVLAPGDTKVIATFGDSITDGTSSTPDTNNRYPNRLAQRIAAQGGNAAVLNLGIAGNRVLNSLIGPNALSRFDRDVIARPGVTHVIVLEGINDIGLPGLIGQPDQEVTVEQITAGYEQLIERAHSHNIKIIGATLTPYKTAIYYTEEGDVKRMAVNEWIRNSGAFDGYVDFDLALQDPDNPLQILPAYDSGDNLHPSDTGYQAMADTIDLTLLGINDGESGAELVTASRYDAEQGEIFWQKGSFSRFNVYRDSILQSVTPIGGNSFYQRSLNSGVAYLYEVVALDVTGNEIQSLGAVNMPTENGDEGGSLVSGERYDASRAEVFWDKQGFSEFRVYRDGELVTPDNNFGNSFYQSNLAEGQPYLYQINGIDSDGNETLLGTLQMPGSVGLADPV